MSIEPNSTGRVRVVCLSLLLVASILGGATAVVGGTDATQPATATQQQQASTGTGSGAAAPDSVGITAGATNQTAVASAGAGPATFEFSESEAGTFSTNGTATLGLPSGADVAFDPTNTSAVASADGATVSVTDVTPTTVTIDVASTDGNATTTVRVAGLRFESTGDAAAVDATWTFGTASAATAVEPERLEVTGLGADLARGADGTPAGTTGVFAQAPSAARTEGFVAASRNFAIRIPDGLRDDVAFDTTASLTVRTEGGDCGVPVVADPRQENYFLEDHQIIVELSCEIGRDEYLEVTGIAFNVSGADAVTPPEIEGQLAARYQPVDRTGSVTVDAGDPIRAHAPVVSTDDTTVEAGRTNVTGDGAATVSIADDVGALLGNGSHVTVELEDTGVTFNESQTVAAETVDGDATPPTVVSANATTVVLDVRETTDAGDEFRLQGAGGDGLRFDVAPGAGETAFRVTTSPGADAVTQVTDAAVVVDVSNDDEPPASTPTPTPTPPDDDDETTPPPDDDGDDGSPPPSDDDGASTPGDDDESTPTNDDGTSTTDRTGASSSTTGEASSDDPTADGGTGAGDASPGDGDPARAATDTGSQGDEDASGSADATDTAAGDGDDSAVSGLPEIAGLTETTLLAVLAAAAVAVVLAIVGGRVVLE